ncbi:MAG: tRNA 2-thiouridine(34) synthase MnmA [Bdellovibrionales bacterium]
MVEKKDKQNRRILVAMSGGVDSSVTAAVLKQQGYDVEGVTLLLHEQGDHPRRHIEDAQKVAAIIGVPHHVLDLRKEFLKNVIGDLADTYAKGETPNPCARCNKMIKFGALISMAREIGAAALATGHYARLVAGKEGTELHCAEDKTRDQSYFLFLASQEQLDFLRFPLGEMKNKAETRIQAERFGLPVAAKPDSQDICFVPSGDYAGLVERLRPEAASPGDIVDEAGNTLGQHNGIIYFTVGQRRGINISGREGDNNEPLYVVRLNAEKKQVVVGPKASLMQKEVYLHDVNWLGGDVPEEGIAVKVKLRSAQSPAEATFQMLGAGRGLITLAEAAFGIAPGQAGVIYDGTRVLGGGWIERKN